MQSDPADIVKALNAMTNAIAKLPASNAEVDSVVATAIASVALAVATIASVWLQIRANNAQVRERREQTQIEQTLRLAEKYESSQMRKARSDLAAVVLNEALAGRPSDAQCEPILDFFETVGYMDSRGLLDEGIFFNEFSVPVLHWWPALEKQVTHLRQDVYHDTTIYEEIERLSRKVAADEQANNHPAPSPDKVQAFLRTEVLASNQ